MTTCAWRNLCTHTRGIISCSFQPEAASSAANTPANRFPTQYGLQIHLLFGAFAFILTTGSACRVRLSQDGLPAPTPPEPFWVLRLIREEASNPCVHHPYFSPVLFLVAWGTHRRLHLYLFWVEAPGGADHEAGLLRPGYLERDEATVSNSVSIDACQPLLFRESCVHEYQHQGSGIMEDS